MWICHVQVILLLNLLRVWFQDALFFMVFVDERIDISVVLLCCCRSYLASLSIVKWCFVANMLVWFPIWCAFDALLLFPYWVGLSLIQNSCSCFIYLHCLMSSLSVPITAYLLTVGWVLFCKTPVYASFTCIVWCLVFLFQSLHICSQYRVGFILLFGHYHFWLFIYLMGPVFW